MLETCLIQTVISNMELCQLGSPSGDLNKATGSEVKVFDKVERPQSWEKLGQLRGEAGWL